MSQKRGTRRAGGHVRLAAVVMGAALTLPGLAVASHTTCDKQSNEVGTGINCPEFSPGLEASVSNRVVDAEADISFEYSQADHESSTMLIEAYLPKYWQLNTQIRTADSNSDDVEDPGADGCTGNAEAISGNSWRLRSLTGSGRTATERVGSARFGSYDSATQTISACARMGGTPAVNLPFSVTKLSSGHPYAATAGWKVTISTRAFVESVKASDGSMVRLHFDLNQRTGGKWHKNQSGQLERAIFSQVSYAPVTTDLRVDATTCRRGMSTAPADAATGCLGNATLTKLVATEAFNLSPAPTVAPLNFAHLTAPTRLPGTTAEKVGPVKRDGFGLVMGSDDAVVKWAKPSAHPDETVKGYALVIAIPGNQGSRSGTYMVTDPATAGFDASVCGDEGADATTCDVTLTAGSLPRLDGAGSLHPDFDGTGKYDLALVTIFKSGKRTDGRCDDGTVYGALCDPTTPLWYVNGIRQGSTATIATLPGNAFGISTWQFLWRTKSYPSVSLETSLQSNFSGSADDETEPFILLFVDYATKEGELVIFGGYQIKTIVGQARNIEPSNAGDGPATSFRSRSNLIIGDPMTDPKTGLVAFSNNASPTGTALRFDYVGETDPSGTYGMLTLLDPGDVSLGSSVPPSPASKRPSSLATHFVSGGTV